MKTVHYVQVVAREAAITASPGGEVVVRAGRGTVLELKSASARGYQVLLHSGQVRLLGAAAAREVPYRPIAVEDPALRQQVVAAIVEAEARARQEAQARPGDDAVRERHERLLTDRYAFDVAQRYSLSPPVLRAVAASSGVSVVPEGTPPASAPAVSASTR